MDIKPITNIDALNQPLAVSELEDLNNEEKKLKAELNEAIVAHTLTHDSAAASSGVSGHETSFSSKFQEGLKA